MTHDAKLKKTIRARMERTGQNFTTARRAVLAEAAHATPAAVAAVDLCLYCAVNELTGDETPEHIVPAAIRGGLTTTDVCETCNETVGKEIDYPFLNDDFILMERAMHDVRDPRHAKGERRVQNPMDCGFTEEGVFVTLDEDGTPRVHGKIIESEDGSEFQIVAASEAQLKKLTDRVIARAQAAGKEATVEEMVPVSGHPKVTGRIVARPWVWRRELAKIALGCASKAYPKSWQGSEDADRLRAWMRDPKALPYDHCPFEAVEGSPAEPYATPPTHTLFFIAGNDQTVLVVILFGSIVFKIPVETANTYPRPQVAWQLDTTKPNDPGETTFERLTMNAALRHQGEAEYPFRIPSRAKPAGHPQ
jgi:hypothetical protein